MKGYTTNIDAFFDILRTCVNYIPVCLFTAASAILLGLIFGIILTVLRVSKVRLLKWLANTYVIIVRSIPSILLLLIVYYIARYGFAEAAAGIPPLTIAVMALSISGAAFLSNTIKSALSSVDKGQMDAGLSIGMKRSVVFSRYILPQAVPVAIPMLGNQMISMLRATSLISYVGVMDIVMAGKTKGTLYSNNLEAYFAEAVIYWILTILLERIFFLVNKRNKWHYAME